MSKKKRNTAKQILKRSRDEVPNYTFDQLKERLEREMRGGSAVPFVCTIEGLTPIVKKDK